jgi:AraC-like DNA-binding protein
MFKILFLFTSSIGFVTLLLLMSRAKNNGFLNKYLIMSFFLITVKFFLLGIRDIFFSEYCSNFDIITNLPGLLIIILLYLYFEDLVKKKKRSLFKDFLHFFAFFFLYVLTLLIYQGILNISIKFCVGLFIIYFFYYLVMSYLILKNKFCRDTNNITITNKQHTILRNWMLFLFICMVFIFIRTLIEFVIYELNVNFQHSEIFLIISSIIASTVFIKVLMTPEILYGYTFLTNRLTDVNKKNTVITNIWIKKLALNLANVQENNLSEIVFQNLDNCISEIESIDFSYKNYKNPDFSLIDLSNFLSVPKSHLAFLFKHHCTLSFTNYKKAVRINEAIKLIDEGYLKSNTIESLAKDIGFSSYSPFYTSFKMNTGLTPQEYFLNKEKVAVL